MAKATAVHIKKLIILHSGRIIRGRGISLKSAPLMPFESDMAPIANAMKTDSKNSTIVALMEGLKAITPTAVVMGSITSVKKTINAYLLLMKSFAEIGDM